MWAKLDDALIDHRKLFVAGDVIGKNGPAIALGLYAVGILYSNKHLTDGFLAEAVVRRWTHVDRPLAMAEALVAANLWERTEGGFRIHDFHDHNLKAVDVHEKRKADRDRKKKGGDNRHKSTAESKGTP
jgi:hypothetical protein